MSGPTVVTFTREYFELTISDGMSVDYAVDPEDPDALTRIYEEDARHMEQEYEARVTAIERIVMAAVERLGLVPYSEMASQGQPVRLDVEAPAGGDAWLSLIAREVLSGSQLTQLARQVSEALQPEPPPSVG